MTKKKAKKIISRGLRNLKYLKENYSGCDWCCGGGDKKYREITNGINEALNWLKDNRNTK